MEVGPSYISNMFTHSGDNVRVRHNMNADKTRQQLYQNYYVKVTFKLGFYSMPSNVPRKL